jgi:hypothetical protein
MVVATLLALPGAARAQGRPFAYSSVHPRSVTVGQPVTLTVDVYVPSYFTSAPRFPTLEVKDAVVVFDDEGSNLSQRVGETDYAGQRRSYRIFPQRAGRFEVPGVEVRVRFGIDGKPSPRTLVAAKGGAFDATVPAAARGLGYFVATPSFELTQTTDRPPTGLKVGDSITRTLGMSAAGAFAMMLPPLDFPAQDGLAVYAAEPRTSDSSGERGAVRVGSRVESATYVLQKPGAYRLPAVEIHWWDTNARVMRTAAAPELAFEVAPNPDAKAEIPLPVDPTATPPPPDRLRRTAAWLGRYGAVLVLALVGLALAWRVVGARLRAARSHHAERVRRREESAASYLERLRRQAGGTPAELLAAVYRWLDRRGGTGAAARLDEFAKQSGDPELPELAADLVDAALGGAEADPASGRQVVEHLARADAREAPAPSRHALGPLNPR